MKQILSLIGITALVAVTLGAGWVHGRMTNRWGIAPDSNLAAARLRQPLPDRVGSWKLVREADLEPEVVRMLQCPASVSRVYEHEQTGDVISVAVLLGPPGPISVHTPEICYSSHDYAITKDREKTTLTDAANHEHSLWEVRMKSNRIDGAQLRVLYGWTTGERWLAAEYPRFGYGGVSHLYKLQLASGASAAEALEDFDPAKDFLQQFVVQLQGRIVSSQPPADSAGE
jgi:hypothetical protein